MPEPICNRGGGRFVYLPVGDARMRLLYRSHCTGILDRQEQQVAHFSNRETDRAREAIGNLRNGTTHPSRWMWLDID